MNLSNLKGFPLEGEALRFAAYFVDPPSWESPSKILHHIVQDSCWQLDLIAKGARSSICALYASYIIGNGAVK